MTGGHFIRRNPRRKCEIQRVTCKAGMIQAGTSLMRFTLSILITLQEIVPSKHQPTRDVNIPLGY